MYKVSVWSKSRWVTFIIQHCLTIVFYYTYCVELFVSPQVDLKSFYIVLGCDDFKKWTKKQGLKYVWADGCVHVGRVNQYQNTWKPPYQAHKHVRRGEGGGLGLGYIVLGVKTYGVFFVLGKANRPRTCMTYRHEGRDRFGLAEGRGRVTGYFSHCNNSLEHGTPWTCTTNNQFDFEFEV